MRKLKLQVEELVVDSFEAVGGRRKAAGTVQGHQDTVAATVCTYSHQYNISCAYGCSNYCAYTLYETCEGPTCNSPQCVKTQ